LNLRLLGPEATDTPSDGPQPPVNTSPEAHVSPALDGPGRHVANAVANAPDPVEADLMARIVRAELEGRTTVADALARHLEAHRAARAAGNVVNLAGHRRKG